MKSKVTGFLVVGLTAVAAVMIYSRFIGPRVGLPLIKSTEVKA